MCGDRRDFEDFIYTVLCKSRWVLQGRAAGAGCGCGMGGILIRKSVRASKKLGLVHSIAKNLGRTF